MIRPMSSLSGPQKELLRNAVMTAFPNGVGLKQWLGRNLHTEQSHDNILADVNIKQSDSDIAYDLVELLEAKGRIIEFLAKLAPSYPNPDVLMALREILACSENESDAQQRIQEFLEILAKQPRNERSHSGRSTDPRLPRSTTAVFEIGGRAETLGREWTSIHAPRTSRKQSAPSLTRSRTAKYSMRTTRKSGFSVLSRGIGCGCSIVR